jgi:hypothetical protein
MAASIIAVAAICATAPAAQNARNRPCACGTASPLRACSRARNSSANGKPNKNRTCVAPAIPIRAVRLDCMVLRAVCAAAAIRVTGIHKRATDTAVTGSFQTNACAAEAFLAVTCYSFAMIGQSSPEGRSA